MRRETFAHRTQAGRPERQVVRNSRRTPFSAPPLLRSHLKHRQGDPSRERIEPPGVGPLPFEAEHLGQKPMQGYGILDPDGHVIQYSELHGALSFRNGDAYDRPRTSHVFRQYRGRRRRLLPGGRRIRVDSKISNGWAPERMDAIVFHVDADAFFAACHLAVDPALRGLPLVVGGDPATRHGIVLTATYEARRYGVRTAMPLGQALRLCPGLTVIPPQGGLYQEFSRRLRRLFDDFSPVVEPASVDEAWLDMGGGVLRRFGNDPVVGARVLQGRAQEEIGLSVSIGIARNKMLAKQASDLDKPHGLTTLWPDEVAKKLWPKPVQALYGVGPKLGARFLADGIVTIGDLAALPATELRRRYGAVGPLLLSRAQGTDDTPVNTPRAGEEKSLSVERTLAHDVTTTAQAEPHLRALAHELAGRLRAQEQAGRTVTLKYKTHEFVLHTRQRTLSRVSRSEEILYGTARELFLSRPHPEAVRLLGLGVSALAREQADLFEDPRERILAETVDEIRSRFGTAAIGPARLPLRRESPPSTFRRNPDPPEEKPQV